MLCVYCRCSTTRARAGGGQDAAYWIDGMTRLGLVLHDATLLARVKKDYDFVLAHPYQFHNTWLVL